MTLAYQRLKKILRISDLTPRICGILAIYALVIGVLTLIIPIAAQALINLVAFNTVALPILVLAFIVLVFLLAASLLRLFQRILIEIIQQKIFAKIAIQFAEQIPKITPSAFHHFPSGSPESVNRIFDAVIVQKSTASLMLYALELGIQILVSLILLSLYSPYLMVYSLLLILAIVLTLKLPWRGAVETAIAESAQKHRVGGWLEELARSHTLFKLKNNQAFALEKADKEIIGYLKIRKRHFLYVIGQIIATYGIYILSTTFLLMIGGFLVMKSQITLGQLVAAEIIVTALLYNLLSLGYYLEMAYDLIAASDEVGTVLDLPRDHHWRALENPAVHLDEGICVQVQEINFYNHVHQRVVQNLSFEVAAGAAMAIVGGSGRGKTVLLNMLVGLLTPQSGLIKINQVPIKDYTLGQLWQHVALVREVEIFMGSISENLILHRNEISVEEMQTMLDKLQLSESIAQLPQGLETPLSADQTYFSSSQAIRLMCARALLTRPHLLLIDGVLDNMPFTEAQELIKMIRELAAECTLIVATCHSAVAYNFEHKITL